MTQNTPTLKKQLVLAAAGLGTRLGRSEPKALVALAGEPMFLRTLETFRSADLLANAIVVAPPDHRDRFEDVVRSAYPDARCAVVPGGRARQDSVAAGLARLDPDTEIVVIHDAARPFVSQAAIARSIEAAAEYGAATVAVRCVDTILQADEDDFLTDTPDRRTLWACQTPQTFRVDVIRAAYETAARDGAVATDDASLVARTGRRVKLVEGDRGNMKITTPEDLAFAAYRVAHEQTASTQE